MQIVKDGGFDVFTYTQSGSNDCAVTNDLKTYVSVIWGREQGSGKLEMIVVIKNAFFGSAFTSADICGFSLGMTGSSWGFDYYANGTNTGFCNYDDTSTYVRINSSNVVFRNTTNAALA
jgi:hypothetical protein